MGTTGTMMDARAEFERLRAEHVELEREFNRLRQQWPVDRATHEALLGTWRPTGTPSARGGRISGRYGAAR